MRLEFAEVELRIHVTYTERLVTALEVSIHRMTLYRVKCILSSLMNYSAKDENFVAPNGIRFHRYIC